MRTVNATFLCVFIKLFFSYLFNIFNFIVVILKLYNVICLLLVPIMKLYSLSLCIIATTQADYYVVSW